MTITTKGGDKGFTTLKDRRVTKDDISMEALGNLDEVSSLIILIQSLYQLELSVWQPIVESLYKISSVLSGYKDSVDLNETLNKLESYIKSKQFLTSQFIFPYNQTKVAHLHYLRAVIRRAERSVVALSHQQSIPESILIYLNRLSDFVFACEL